MRNPAAGLLALALVSAVTMACAASAPPTASAVGTPLGVRPNQLVTPTPAGQLDGPTPTASPWPLSVVYVSPYLAYRIQLPQGYRRSECLSPLPVDPRSRPFLGSETLTLLSPEQEASLAGPFEVPTVSPAQAWTFHVSVLATDMPAMELAERDGCLTCDPRLPDASPAPDPLLGRPPVDRIEPLTIAGQEAARRIRDGGQSFYVVRAGDRAYVIRFLQPESDAARPRPVELGPDPLASVMATFRAEPGAVIFRAARPPAITAATHEAGARLARALEAGDLDGIAALATPQCWLAVIVEPGGASSVTVSSYLAQLRARFASGLRVRADPSLTGQEPSIRSEWTEGGRTFRVDLRLREIDGIWYWSELYQSRPG